MGAITSFFRTPARQALGWTFLGLVGIAMAAGGVWFLTGDGDSPRVADAFVDFEGTATATATVTATTVTSPSATVTPSATSTATATAATSEPATATPRATATRTVPNTNTGTGGAIVGGADEPTPEPTAEPTVVPQPTLPPVVAGGGYCPPGGVGPGSLPSGRVAGAVRVGGVDAPAGTVDLFVAFDGVLGPSTTNLARGFRIDFYANIQSCANSGGAAISVYANGQYFPTGRSVGDDPSRPVVEVSVELP